jgi:hypothetical protein
MKSSAPDDGQKHCPKHVEVTWNNKLIYIVQIVGNFHNCITMHGLLNVMIPSKFFLGWLGWIKQRSGQFSFLFITLSDFPVFFVRMATMFKFPGNETFTAVRCLPLCSVQIGGKWITMNVSLSGTVNILKQQRSYLDELLHESEELKTTKQLNRSFASSRTVMT